MELDGSEGQVIYQSRSLGSELVSFVTAEPLWAPGFCFAFYFPPFLQFTLARVQTWASVSAAEADALCAVALCCIYFHPATLPPNLPAFMFH